MSDVKTRRPRRWTAFGLRTLFIVVTLVLALAGWTFDRKHRRQQAISVLRDNGVVVDTEYDRAEFERSSQKLLRAASKPHPSRSWKDKLLGEQVVQISAHDQHITADMIREINRFPEVQQLSFRGSDLNDAHFEQLSIGEEVRILDLSNTLLTDDSGPLLQRFRNLTWCELADLEITGKTVTYLKDMRSLEVLRLRGTKVKRDDLKQLSHLTKLQDVSTGASFRKRKSPAEPKG